MDLTIKILVVIIMILFPIIIIIKAVSQKVLSSEKSMAFARTKGADKYVLFLVFLFILGVIIGNWNIVFK